MKTHKVNAYNVKGNGKCTKAIDLFRLEFYGRN